MIGSIYNPFFLEKSRIAAKNRRRQSTEWCFSGMGFKTSKQQHPFLRFYLNLKYKDRISGCVI